MSKSFWAAWVMLVVGLVGCGGKSAEEKCDDLIVTLCARGAECASELGNDAECLQAARAGLPCDRAVDVSDRYEDCMDDLEGNSCASLFPRDSRGNLTISLPSACVGSIELAGGLDEALASSFFEPVSRAALTP